jgi:transposase-like protein
MKVIYSTHRESAILGLYRKFFTRFSTIAREGAWAMRSAIQFSISEAAQLLGVTSRTLRGWLRQDHIQSMRSETDHRARMITLEELRPVAAKHKRPFIIPQERREELTLESLATRLDALEQSFHFLQLQRKAEQARGGLAGRLLRRMQTNLVVRESDTAAYPPIKDVQLMVQAAIDLVNAVPQLPFGQPKEMIVTSLGETDVFDLIPLLRYEWRWALERAMRRGWRVIHLIRQVEDLARAMAVAEDLMQLLTGPRGAYLPLFTPLSTLAGASPQEFVAVPGGGILELRSSAGRYMDIALLHQEEQLETLYAKLEPIRTVSVPIVTPFPSLSVEFSQAITAAESAEGNRYLVMNGLSELTIPLSIHQARAEDILAQPTDSATYQKVQELLAIRKQRADIFERRVQQWRYRDVCPMSAIRHYVKTGIFSPDDVFTALGCPPLTPAQRRDHLNHLIYRLETCPNYELGLVDESVHDAAIYHTFWLVKGGHMVLLECQSLTAEGEEEEIDLAISEPRIVDAFYEHFFRLWEQLRPLNRDKQHVIAWLKAQLSEITRASTSA